MKTISREQARERFLREMTERLDRPFHMRKAEGRICDEGRCPEHPDAGRFELAIENRTLQIAKKAAGPAGTPVMTGGRQP